MTDYVCKSPVLVCGFNRPDLLANCLEHVRAVNPPRLYISIDGPRAKVKSDAALVEQCREIARSINWCPDVRLKIEPTNLGCRFGPLAGINWFFRQEPHGIVLEDDIEASPAFFDFCDRFLVDPPSNIPIGVISGYTPVPSSLTAKADVFFSKYSHTWGWASWSHLWFEIPQDPASITREMTRGGLMTGRTHGSGIDAYWWDRVKLARDHKYDVWDITFGQNLSYRRILSISPAKSMVRNIGFIGSSSHTSRLRSDLGFDSERSIRALPQDLRIDFETDLDWAHDKYHFGFGEGANYWPRLKSKVYYFLNIAPFGKTAIRAISKIRSA